MSLDTIPSGLRTPEVIVNANFQAMDQAKMFGIHLSATAGLTLGIYGGNMLVSGTNTPIADIQLSLTASSTCYVECSTAGVISFNTSAFTGGSTQIGIAVTGTSTITTWTDKRISGSGAGGGGSVSLVDVKDSVRAGTTANITLSGAQTIDGVSVIAGNRVLVKNQSTGSQNGIYVAASGAWARAADASTSAQVTAGMFVFITEGSTLADTGWILTTVDPIVLATTALVFAQFNAGGAPSGAAGGDLTGTYPNPTFALSTVHVWTKNQSVTPSTLTDAATIAVDASLSNNFKVVLGGNRTLGNPTNLTDGMVLNFKIKQDGTGSRTLAYGSKYKWTAGVAPVLSTAINAVDFISTYYDSTDDILIGTFVQDLA